MSSAHHKKEKNKSFETAVEDHSTYLFSLSYRLTGSFQDAQDLMQETLLRAWWYWHKLENKNNPIPWLGKICVNLFIDNNRKSETNVRKESAVFPDMEWGVVPGESTCEDEVLADEEVRLVHSQCFTIISSKLPLYQRIVLVMNDIYKVPIQDLSVLIVKTPAATKALLHRAREKMTSDFGSFCSVVDPVNSCKCRPWIAFAHNIQKRRELLNHVLSTHIPSEREMSDSERFP